MGREPPQPAARTLSADAADEVQQRSFERVVASQALLASARLLITSSRARLQLSHTRPSSVRPGGRIEGR